MSDEENLVKIHVTLTSQGGPGGETLWALPTEKADEYEVRNVPYFTYGINCHDIVRCASGRIPEVKEVVRAGGHRTMRIMFQPGTAMNDMNSVVQELHDKGGHPDLGFPGFLSLDIGPDKDFDDIFTYLTGLHEKGVLVFETAEAQVEGSFDAASE